MLVAVALLAISVAVYVFESPAPPMAGGLLLGVRIASAAGSLLSTFALIAGLVVRRMDRTVAADLKRDEKPLKEARRAANRARRLISARPLGWSAWLSAPAVVVSVGAASMAFGAVPTPALRTEGAPEAITPTALTTSPASTSATPSAAVSSPPSTSPGPTATATPTPSGSGTADPGGGSTGGGSGGGGSGGGGDPSGFQGGGASVDIACPSESLFLQILPFALWPALPPVGGIPVMSGHLVGTPTCVTPDPPYPTELGYPATTTWAAATIEAQTDRDVSSDNRGQPWTAGMPERVYLLMMGDGQNWTYGWATPTTAWRVDDSPDGSGCEWTPAKIQEYVGC